jgi:FkbM family methyltransferase
LAAGVRGATVWAFEPDPQAAHFLKRNIALNALQSLVTIYECAVGDRDGELTFTVGLDTMNRVATSSDASVQTVKVQQLDKVVIDFEPIMIKMDVEGHEEAAIRGAKAILANHSLKVIALETVTQQIEQAFEGHGFSRAYYDPYSRRLTSSEMPNGASNAVYVRDWEFVSDRLSSAPNVTVLGKSI